MEHCIRMNDNAVAAIDTTSHMVFKQAIFKTVGAAYEDMIRSLRGCSIGGCGQKSEGVQLMRM